MADDCIFCKIVRGEIPANILYENEHVLAFPDIAPAAPVHILLIPKNHVDNILQCHPSADNEMNHLLQALPEVVKTCQLEEKGFRLVINTGEEGGQTVSHLHMHLIGGRACTWPPG